MEKTITYAVFAEPAGSGANWGAWIPDLGVYATAPTRADAVSQVKAAARSQVAYRREAGLALPEPQASTSQIEVAAV